MKLNKMAGKYDNERKIIMHTRIKYNSLVSKNEEILFLLQFKILSLLQKHFLY